METVFTRGFIYSLALHTFMLLFAYFGLPSLFKPDIVHEPKVITAEILPLREFTNVRPTQPSEQKNDQPKPNPAPPKEATPVKTESKPEPKPVEKEYMPDKEKPKEQVKEEKKPEPKPEEKKEDKKPEKKKPKQEDDLAAILKSVKESAKQKTPDTPKDDGAADDKKPAYSEKYNPDMELGMNEKDFIRQQIAKYWSVPAGVRDAHQLIISLGVALNRDGTVIEVEILDRGRYSRDELYRAAADSAVRAIKRASPLQGLPPEKYDGWKEMELNFDPRDMLY